jgi:hypothetical protein
MLNAKVLDHIKEVQNMSLKTKRAQMRVPKSMLRLYLLQLALMHVKVEVEDESNLFLDWTDTAVAELKNKRNGKETMMRTASKLQEK